MFQIAYLMFSTYFAGNALAGLAGLRLEIEQKKRQYAWGRRQISKNLIDELQAEEHDGKVDQYEFLVASLVQLGKISSEDVIPIMDKYRSLAGESGYIQESLARAEATDQEIQDAIDEQTQQRIPFTNKHIRTPSFIRQRASAQRKGYRGSAANSRSRSANTTSSQSDALTNAAGLRLSEAARLAVGFSSKRAQSAINNSRNPVSTNTNGNEDVSNT